MGEIYPTFSIGLPAFSKLTGQTFRRIFAIYGTNSAISHSVSFGNFVDNCLSFRGSNHQIPNPDFQCVGFRDSCAIYTKV